MIKKLLFFVLLCTAYSTCSWARILKTVTQNGVYYCIAKSGDAAVYKYEKGLEAAIIADSVTYNGVTHPVSAIGLFAENQITASKLKTLSIPNTVKAILSLGSCYALQELIVPDNPISFGNTLKDKVFITSVKRQNGTVPTYLIEQLSPTCPFVLAYKEQQFQETPQNNNLQANVNNNRSSGNGELTNRQMSENMLKSDVDINQPANASNNSKTFAVIIGNEKYTQVAEVPYAQNDANVFGEYCKKTLGLPTNNLRIYSNATFGTMLSAVNDIKRIAEAYKGDCNIIFYYAGHGVPNEVNKEAYLLPVDADGMQTEVCYPVSRLYKELGDMGARSVVVFMDACFSGAQRGEGMLASARGVALKAKASAPQGNMVVFSAATGDETAFPFKEKGHGMFTYFLLKKLQESKGDCTLGELGDYIQTNVRQQSVVVNRKNQTPTIVPSATMIEKWKNLKLR